MPLTIIAFIFCSICCVLTLNASKAVKDSVMKLCLLMLCLISGFRYMGGSDLFVYEAIYDAALPLRGFELVEANGLQYEVGYRFLISSLKTLGISYYGHIFLSAAFFYLCLWFGLKRYTREFSILILVFLYKLFYYNTFVSMRQSITIAGFFFLIRFIENKDWKRYYLFCVPLSLFHNGALLLYLLYPIAYIKLSKRLIIWANVVFIPTIAFSFLGIDALGPVGSLLNSANVVSGDSTEKIAGAFDGATSAIGLFHTLEYFFFMFFLLKNYDKIIQLPHYKDICVKLFLLLLPLFTLFRGSEILTREKDYFVLMYAALICYFMQLNNGRNKYIWVAFTVVWCAFGFLRFTILFDGGHFLNYISWLDLPNSSFFLN